MSCTSRDFPSPGPPEISTIQPDDSLASTTTWDSVASSRSRPTSGASVIADTRCPTTEPTTEARIGSVFPLAANGSIGVVVKAVRERSSTISVERICPASALLITRAAVLMASPKTRYDRR